MNDILVRKKDGGTEYFSFDKLLFSIGKAGVPMKDAEKIAREIEKWTELSENKKSLTSSMLREKVIEMLINDFPAEADSYKAYK